MMFQKALIAVVVVLVAVYTLTSPAQTQSAEEAAASWRHLALADTGKDEAEVARNINQLGRDGWQLVDVESFVANGETSKTVYYFKKPSDR